MNYHLWFCLVSSFALSWVIRRYFKGSWYRN